MDSEDAGGDHDETLPSKSQAKRELRELRDTASALGQLSREQIMSLSASPELRAGLLELKQLGEGQPRRRQIHYLGRRLLEEDEQSLRRELASCQSGTREHSRRLHMAERWRDRLLEEGKTALTAFIETFPDTDRQHLRQLISKAAGQAVSQQGKHNPRRRLYRYIRERIDAIEHNHHQY